MRTARLRVVRMHDKALAFHSPRAVVHIIKSWRSKKFACEFFDLQLIMRDLRIVKLHAPRIAPALSVRVTQAQGNPLGILNTISKFI